MYSISDLVNKYSSGILSPTDHIQNELQKLKQVNLKINAVSQFINEAYILQQAKASTDRYKSGKPLSEIDGILITIKDTDTNASKGIPIHNGSLLPSKYWIPKQSAPHINILQQNGAIILCQTTASEMCWKGATSTLLHGITRNPHNLQLTSGGSSGGAVALCASGINGIHLGSDGGGSIRGPSAACGVIGLKPTYPIGSSSSGSKWPYLSHVGPITQYVDDCRIYMKLITQKRYSSLLDYNYGAKSNVIKCDIKKLYAMDFSSKYMRKGIKGLKIAVSKTLDGSIADKDVDKNIWKCVTDACGILKQLGAEIEFIDPKLNDMEMKYYEIWPVIWQSTMNYYYGSKHVTNENKHLVDPYLLKFMNKAKNISVNELIKCLNIRDELCLRMNIFMDKYDLLITPTLATLPTNAVAYDVEFWRKYQDMNKAALRGMYTMLFNFTHQPALSMNCGFINNVPIGIQIAAGLYKDDVILRAAYALQQYIKPKIAKL